MNKKAFTNIKMIIIIIVVLVGIGIACYFIVNRQKPLFTPVFSLAPNLMPKLTSESMATPSQKSTSDEAKCTDYSVVKLNNNQSFIYNYNNDNELQAISEMKFEGVLREHKKVSPGISTTHMRELTYNLDGKAIYTTEDDLSKYVGKRVVLIGKNYKFELEGIQADEIWPVSIVCKQSKSN